MSICQFLLAFLALLAPVICHPLSNSYSTGRRHEVGTGALASFLPATGLSNGVALRILPVGDSITVGVGSTDGNGYRLNLLNKIKDDGHQVEFVGTQSSGKNNPSPYHEGYGWNRISQIMDHVKGNHIIDKQPNLILIHAGTNDDDWETWNETYSQTPERLGSAIDYFLSHDPGAVVLVARLIQNKYNSTSTAIYNAAIPAVVFDRKWKGYKVGVVDMTPVSGQMLNDTLHPNDEGYRMMTDIWHQAITSIPQDWWSTGTAMPTMSFSNSLAVMLLSAMHSIGL